VNNKEEVLAICSEFTEEYGFNIEEEDTLVVYIKSEYLNELRRMLEKQNYKIHSYQVYGDEMLAYFIPNN